MCLETQSTPPARRGLRCRHVPHDTERATRQERALVSPRAPRYHARHSPGEGSGVATCPEAPSSSPGRRRLRSRHAPRGFRPAPCAGRLWRRHVTEAPGPPLGRAPVPARVLRLQTRLLVREGSGATTCPVALGPRAYPCRQRIKSVCDSPYATYGRH
jgi:hypothetical protein